MEPADRFCGACGGPRRPPPAGPDGTRGRLVIGTALAAYSLLLGAVVLKPLGPCRWAPGTDRPSPVPAMGRARPPVAGPITDDEAMGHVPAGEVLLEDGRRVQVEAFWIDQHEVTNGRFLDFVGATGYVTEAELDGVGLAREGPGWVWTPGVAWRHPLAPGDLIERRLDHPVVQVSWADAEAFCRWAGKRLPTSAQWERAARGGQAGGRYPWGDADPRGRAWFGQPPTAGPIAVGSFPPNALGLFDMAGNVVEWCLDGTGVAGGPRLARGGSWASGPEGLACARSAALDPAHRSPELGFRCVRMAAPEPAP